MQYSLQLAIIVLFPYAAIKAAERWSLARKISPIVLCFAIGIILCNVPILPLSENVSTYARNVAIMLAMPLLLFSSDIRSWLDQSTSTIISFLGCIASVILACVIASWFFLDDIPKIWQASGMTAGILTGGTVNLFAVAKALGVDSETITLVNSAQIFWGAIYLLFLLTLASRLFGLVLKTTAKEKPTNEYDGFLEYEAMNKRDISIGIALALGILAASVGISFLLWQRINDTFIIIAITTLSLLFSLQPCIGRLKGPFEIGDYCLLSFGVAVGMSSNFFVLAKNGGHYIAFMIVIFLLAVGLHLLFCYVFGIDRDTFIITSVAAIYGPVFIAQMAQALSNRQVIVGGIAASLCGLALGNYCGLFVSMLIEWLFLE